MADVNKEKKAFGLDEISKLVDGHSKIAVASSVLNAYYVGLLVRQNISGPALSDEIKDEVLDTVLKDMVKVMEKMEKKLPN